MWQQELQTNDEEALDLQIILKDIENGVIGEFFLNEHPQVVALVLSYLEPKQAANILNYLPENLKDEVLNRMEKLGFTQKQFIQKIAKVIKEELKEITCHHGEQKGGVKFVDKVKKEMNQ